MIDEYTYVVWYALHDHDDPLRAAQAVYGYEYDAPAYWQRLCTELGDVADSLGEILGYNGRPRGGAADRGLAEAIARWIASRTLSREQQIRLLEALIARLQED